jgi:glycosyltransferase involved in cell wall biosynthesis
MAEPVLTCVVPTLNSGPTLDFTLASLTAQRGVTARVLVVDSGSTDQTLAICERWNVPSMYEPPGNMYAAIGTGLATAATPWLAYVNSDDYLYGSAWSTLIECAKTAGADIAYGDADFVDADGRFLSSYAGATPAELLSIFRHRIMGFAQPAAIFSARAYRELGGFDPQYRLGADADFFIRALQQGIRYASVRKRPVAAFRLHRGQQTNTKSDSFALELDRVYAAVGAVTATDRIAYLRWRARNMPNYLMRGMRLTMLGRGLHLPTFDSQLDG